MTVSEQTKGTVADALVVMYERGEAIRQREANKTLRKLDGLDAAERAAIEDLADRVVQHVLKPPTQSLLGANAAGEHEAVATALALFEDSQSTAETETNLGEETAVGLVRAQD